MSAPATVADCLGRVRPVAHTFPDGSFTCPFCSAPVVTPAPRCANPGCPAAQHCFSAAGEPLQPAAEAFSERVAAAERSAEEEARRRRDHESAMNRIKEEHAARGAELERRRQQAVERGACVRCATADLFRPARFIKHRGGVCRRK